jgi:hypothetical protein
MWGMKIDEPKLVTFCILYMFALKCYKMETFCAVYLFNLFAYLATRAAADIMNMDEWWNH